MAVIIECDNVLIRNSTVNQRFPGGMQEYERSCPNQSFCTDGQICRVGFMTTADALSYIDCLENLGLAGPTETESPDIALVSQRYGFLFPCDWLELGRLHLGGSEWSQAAWLHGALPKKVVAPGNWKPGMVLWAGKEELSEHEFLGTKGAADVFRDKSTGKLVYTGRTQKGAPPAHISRNMFQERCESLLDELTRLGGMEGVPPGDYEGDAVACYERAKQLVEDTEADLPGPLHLQGIAARILEKWDDAASAFQRVTELCPDEVAGWLELTWALAVLSRLEEAECAARKALSLSPEAADALGNLAAVLLGQGRIDEARPLAEQAVTADPADAKNKALLVAIERANLKGIS